MRGVRPPLPARQLAGCWVTEQYPWEDSNLRSRRRRPVLYPLSYKGGVPGKALCCVGMAGLEPTDLPAPSRTRYQAAPHPVLRSAGTERW